MEYVNSSCLKFEYRYSFEKGRNGVGSYIGIGINISSVMLDRTDM